MSRYNAAFGFGHGGAGMRGGRRGRGGRKKIDMPRMGTMREAEEFQAWSDYFNSPANTPAIEKLETFEEMTSATKVPPANSLFDLPRELRNNIFGYYFELDEPIELAPLHWDTMLGSWVVSADRDVKPTLPYGQAILDPGRVDMALFTGHEWHKQRLVDILAGQEALFLTCKQVYEEAAPIFYKQEFRFTNEVGAMVLATWLRKIGHVHRQQLRHITVAHPLLALYAKTGLRDVNRASLVADVSNDLQHHPNYASGPFAWNPKAGMPQYREGDMLNPPWVEKMDPFTGPFWWSLLADPVTGMSKLANLSIVLSATPSGPLYQHLRYHRLTLYDWNRWLPETKVSLINLVTDVTEALTPSSHQMLLKNAYDSTFVQKLFTSYSTTSEHIQAAGAASGFFDHVKALGWNVEVVFYDNHYSYPAQPEERCVNANICCFLKDHYCWNLPDTYAKTHYNDKNIIWDETRAEMCSHFDFIPDIESPPAEVQYPRAALIDWQRGPEGVSHRIGSREAKDRVAKAQKGRKVYEDIIGKVKRDNDEANHWAYNLHKNNEAIIEARLEHREAAGIAFADYKTEVKLCCDAEPVPGFLWAGLDAKMCLRHGDVLCCEECPFSDW